MAESHSIVIECPNQNSTGNIDFTKSTQSDRPFIMNPRDYDVAVTFIQIPTSAIETFRMKENSDYEFCILSTNKETGEVDVYSAEMPDLNNDNADYDFGIQRYYSPGAVIDSMSRTLIRAYQKYLGSFNQDDYYDEIGQNFEFEEAGTGTVSDSQSFFLVSDGKIADVVVEITSMQLSWYDPDGIQSNRLVNTPVRVILTSPTGTDVELLSLSDASQLDWPADSTKKLELTEGAYRSTSAGVPYNVNDTRIARYLPDEPLIRMSNAKANGEWVLTIRTEEQNITGWINYKIKIRTVPDTVTATQLDYPCTPPAINIDEADRRITLRYHNLYARNNIRLAFSPKLHSIINLGNRNTRYNESLGLFEFLYPSKSNEQDLLVFKQHASTYYMLTNLQRFSVSVPELGTEGDMVENGIQQDYLYDFVIDTDSSGDFGYATKSIEDIPWRRYHVTRKDALTRYLVIVRAHYNHGESLTVPIPPSQTGMVRITFFRRDIF
jgi:hypothetical protein